jgi:hypothetical protein
MGLLMPVDCRLLVTDMNTGLRMNDLGSLRGRVTKSLEHQANFGTGLRFSESASSVILITNSANSLGEAVQ